jgi:hypothetical protein
VKAAVFKSVKRTICLMQAGDFQGVTDTWISSSRPEENLYFSDALEIGGEGSGTALVKFDEIALAAGAEVREAIVTLVMADKDAAKAGIVHAYRMLTDCDFESVTWEYADAANRIRWGNDTQASPKAGVDYDATEAGQADSSVIMAGDTMRIDVTQAARYWQEHPDGNFGLLLAADEGKGAGSFYSSKSPNVSRRPRLYVTYAYRVKVAGD